LLPAQLCEHRLNLRKDAMKLNHLRNYAATIERGKSNRFVSFSSLEGLPHKGLPDGVPAVRNYGDRRALFSLKACSAWPGADTRIYWKKNES
jgi:hypothetical protein